MASSADRHLDITFRLQVVESSPLVSVLFRETFSHPYISFFHLLVNGFSVTCTDTFLLVHLLLYRRAGLTVLLISRGEPLGHLVYYERHLPIGFKSALVLTRPGVYY